MNRLFLLTVLLLATRCHAEERLRLIVETDAGGDPDDEQSMVRFLLYSNEWDVEGIIANRPVAREKENLNTERTGLGIVRKMINAYGECYPKLKENDPRYPEPKVLLEKTVAGYDDVDDGVQLIIKAVDSKDPRPIWFMNWGTDKGSAESCLKRALDRVLKERGPEGYAAFKKRINLSSADKFGDHTAVTTPPFPIWIDTSHPEIEGQRWYRRFSAITARAGGFDLNRDVLKNHGPLGALYPTNTTSPQKEGDSMMFLLLIPNGLSSPGHPDWGSWAGRYALNPEFKDKPYYHATAVDTLNGKTHREITLSRWAVDLQNDFRARLEWCVKPPKECNHPPVVKIKGELRRKANSENMIELDASESSDPDGKPLIFEWIYYKEAGTCAENVTIRTPKAAVTTVEMPIVLETRELHFICVVRDSGTPALTRYARVIVELGPPVSRP